MTSARRILETPAGKIGAGVIAAMGLVAVVVAIRSSFEGSEASELQTNRIFVCSETKKSFRHRIKIGETIPVHSPHSGKATGYPAELCYWTKDGKTKAEPTAVLLNVAVGQSGPTFCPDCERLVVPYNPAPLPESKPPPTRDEHAKQRPGGRRQQQE